jgi:hypothetical protein
VTREISRVEHGLRVTVTTNGKAKSKAVAVLLSDQRDEILAVDELNVILQKDRKAFVEMIPELPLRRSVFDLLTEIAKEVSDMRIQTAPHAARPPENSPFKAVEPWDDPVSGAELLEDLTRIINRYIVLPRHAAVAAALWTLHTYLIDAADYTPYLHVSSPTRECGKSTLLDLLHRLAYRAMLTSGITAAALYRRIDRHGPTMLLDELDTRLRGEHSEIYRGVLNSGFSRDGGVFTICVGDQHLEKDFKTFCPKVLAGIGRLPDTIVSRSIPIRLARASKEELQRRDRIRGHTIDAICEPFRRRLRRWADDHHSELRNQDPQIPAGLGARQADVWRPLFAIADIVGDEWEELARAASLALHSGREDEETDYGLLLLSDIRDLLKQRPSEHILSAVIVSELIKREDRPWPEYRDQRPITPRGVASLLGRFAIKPTTIRVGCDVGKGYKLEALAPAFRRYLQKPDALDVTHVTAQGHGGRRAVI